MLWTTLSHIPRDDHVKVFAEVARCLDTGGRLVVFDNDLAGVSMATHQYDIFKVIMDHFSHAWGADSYIMRNLPAALQKSGFFNVEPLKLHTVVDTDKLSYGFNVGMRAVDIYGEAGIIRHKKIEGWNCSYYVCLVAHMQSPPRAAHALLLF